MKRLVPLAVALVAVLAAGAWYMTQPGGTTPAPLPMAAGAQEAGEVDTSSIQEMVLGQEDAPVEVIEYGSFTCPHCASFHTTAYPQLKKDYIDTGKVKFVFREVYFDKYGMWASMIARCGGGDKFFGIAEMIYKTQSDWARKDSEMEIANGLRKIGLLAGIGKDKLEACLQDGDKLRSLVAWYQENATEDDISATPTFIIDGEKHPNMPWDEFKTLLDEKLAG